MFLDASENQGECAETLGGRIVQAREALSLTTAQLARRLGVKTETLQAWESDRSEPRSNRLLMLAGMLSVSPTWLLMGSGESPIEHLSETEMTNIRSNVIRLREQVRMIADELDQLAQRLDVYQSYRD